VPKRAYALERDGERRVEVAWEPFWRTTRVRVDGEELGVVDGREALTEGATFPLSEGGALEVRLVAGLFPELRVAKDGEPLPGSPADPVERAQQAAGAVLVVAMFSLLLATLGAGWTAVFAAGVYGALGMAVRVWRSRWALLLAIALFVVDGVTSSLLAERPSLVVLGMRVLLLVPMVRGAAALGASPRR
jgi:hypothetical protein